MWTDPSSMPWSCPPQGVAVSPTRGFRPVSALVTEEICKQFGKGLREPRGNNGGGSWRLGRKRRQDSVRWATVF